ncbi:MAG: helix-turn-helix domain-containing protein [Haloarculaceae archaeon]
MPRAQLEISIPESVWIGELSRSYLNAEFEVLTVFPKEEGGVALAEVTAPNVEEVVLELSTYDEVTMTDVLQHSGETALVQFETSNPLLLLPVREAGTPLELPFTVLDGNVDWEVRAPRERLSTLADQLRQFGISFDVVSVHQELETEQLLTPKQRRLVNAAVENGYYDTPRDCSLTELAEAVDIAKSTCSETLHRAEGKIIKQFAEELPTPEEQPVAV